MILLAFMATVLAVAFTLVVFWANGMRSSPGPFSGGLALTCAWVMVGLLWAAFAVDHAWGAERFIVKEIDLPLPPEVTLGYSYDRPIGVFGTYSTNYLRRRWSRMCKGPQRYDAMREAYELGKENPCR